MSGYVMLYNMCHVMVYNVCQVMLYNMCYTTCVMFNNYSPKAKLILLNNSRDEVEGIIQQY